MKVPSIGTLSFGAVGLAAVVLIAIGPPGSHVPPPPPAPSGPAPSNVAFGGFTLTSAAIDLPIDDQQYPDGPHADVINANCTSCHSASMALTQPALTSDQWKSTVIKMKEVYKAPVAEKDIPAIVEYLTALSAKQGSAAPAGKESGSQVAPDASGGTG
ncbi:hypothetical protein [Sphingobium estronivorans]|uniref:hypothetical protein n=1 Tax=Sphingobium estronivorans TaxID=1577690 RepID=UPI001238C72A|nr:hypothetical protein [Sphingobium estronivorans]